VEEAAALEAAAGATSTAPSPGDNSLRIFRYEGRRERISCRLERSSEAEAEASDEPLEGVDERLEVGTVKKFPAEEVDEVEEEIWTFWSGERKVAEEEEAATTVGAEETRRGEAAERDVDGLVSSAGTWTR